MRVFQFHSCYADYLAYFARRYSQSGSASYAERLRLLLEDRFNAVHILEPIYRNEPDVAMTVANDEVLQRQWAKEHGLAARDLTDVLLSQIEEHRAEVIYNLSPVRWDSSFIRRLPSCVKAKIAWLASPSGKADLSGFDLIVSNFPIFLRQWQDQGIQAAYFSPSHDPHMSALAKRSERPIDISFVGTYSKHHLSRNRLLETCAVLGDRYRVVFALAHPKRRPLVDVRFLRRIPGPLPYLPESLRRVAIPPVYGQEMYQLLANSKVVINAAVDFSDQYRGNMRCFEAMGCGACMLSDVGIYPEGLVPGVHFFTFRDAQDAVTCLQAILSDSGRAREIGERASSNLETNFSKSAQWMGFCDLVARL